MSAIPWLLLASTLFPTQADLDWYCFDEDSRATLTYANNPSKTIPFDQFPTIRLMQGMWGSAYATQWIAYMYLREKVGINVDFFPSDDPGIWSTFNDYLAFQDGSLVGYPTYFWAWLEHDDYDFLLETWKVWDERVS